MYIVPLRNAREFSGKLLSSNEHTLFSNGASFPSGEYIYESFMQTRACLFHENA